MNSYKSGLVIACLLFFVYTFHTKAIAQTKPNKEKIVKIGQNVLRFVITKDTKDSQLDLIKQKLAQSNITIVFNAVKRNSTKEITAIEITYDSETQNGKKFVNSEKPIDDIAIEYNVNEDNLTVELAKTALSQTFNVLKDDGDVKLEKSQGDPVSSTVKSNNNDKVVVIDKKGEKQYVQPDKKVIVLKSISDDSDHDVMIIRKDQDGKHSKDTIWVKKETSKVIWTDDEGNETEASQLENKAHTTYVVQAEGKNPIYILDEKEITIDEMSHLDANTIESVNVLKDENAIKIYGEKAKDGAIVITTKKLDNDRNMPSNVNVEDGILVANITKNTTDDELNTYKSIFSEQNITLKFYNIKRNDNGEIVRINIRLNDDKGSKASSAYSNDAGITNLIMGTKKGELFVNSVKEQK